MKSFSVTIRMKAMEQKCPVVLFITLYKVETGYPGSFTGFTLASIEWYVSRRGVETNNKFPKYKKFMRAL